MGVYLTKTIHTVKFKNKFARHVAGHSYDKRNYNIPYSKINYSQRNLDFHRYYTYENPKNILNIQEFLKNLFKILTY